MKCRTWLAYTISGLDRQAKPPAHTRQEQESSVEVRRHDQQPTNGGWPTVILGGLPLPCGGWCEHALALPRVSSLGSAHVERILVLIVWPPVDEYQA